MTEPIAADYDTFLGAITSTFVAATIAAAQVEPGAVVVDVGAGLGHLGRAAHEAGGRVLLVDRSEAMIAEAERRHPMLDVALGDGTALPLASGSADVVLAGFYLNHLDDLGAGLREIRRVLRPGGRLCATLWGEGAAARHSALIDEAAAAVAPGTSGFTGRSGRPSTSALIDAVRAAGFAAPTVRALPQTVVVRSAAELLDGMRRTTWQTAQVISALGKNHRAALVEALADRIAPYRTATGFAIPVGARLVRAMAE